MARQVLVHFGFLAFVHLESCFPAAAFLSILRTNRCLVDRISNYNLPFLVWYNLLVADTHWTPLG
jgi:hypothetical protein